jgi:hypothetical protein
MFAVAAIIVGRIEDVLESFRRCAWRMRLIVEWPLARSTYPTADSESGIGLVTGILVAAVTQIGALMLNDKSRAYLSPTSPGLWFYEVGNLLLLGMLSGILRATKLNRYGNAVGSYDLGTRRFVHFAIVWIIAGAMLVVPAAGFMGDFPTHQVKLSLRDPNAYVFTLAPYAGQEGLSFVVVLQPADFENSVPANLFVKLVETAAFNREWRVANLVKTEVLSGDGSWQPTPTSEGPAMIETDEYASGASREVTFLASHLLPTQSVRMTFRLMPRSSNGSTAAARDAALNVLKTERPITVTAMVPQGHTEK